MKNFTLAPGNYGSRPRRAKLDRLDDFLLGHLVMVTSYESVRDGHLLMDVSL